MFRSSSISTFGMFHCHLRLFFGGNVQRNPSTKIPLPSCVFLFFSASGGLNSASGLVSGVQAGVQGRGGTVGVSLLSSKIGCQEEHNYTAMYSNVFQCIPMEKKKNNKEPLPKHAHLIQVPSYRRECLTILFTALLH